MHPKGGQKRQGWLRTQGLLFLLHLISQPAVGPVDPCHPFLCPRINQQQASLLQSRVPADRMLWLPHPPSLRSQPLQPSCFGAQADSPQGLCTALPCRQCTSLDGPRAHPLFCPLLAQMPPPQGSFLTILSKSAQPPPPSLWPALVSLPSPLCYLHCITCSLMTSSPWWSIPWYSVDSSPVFPMPRKVPGPMGNTTGIFRMKRMIKKRRSRLRTQGEMCCHWRNWRKRSRSRMSIHTWWWWWWPWIWVLVSSHFTFIGVTDTLCKDGYCSLESNSKTLTQMRMDRPH